MNVAALVLLAAKLFVPQGSDEQINHNPLSLGEAAYVQESDNEASVFVGSYGTTPLGVIDRSALRGYKLIDVPRKDFVVIGASPLVRNMQNDTWTWSNFRSNHVATLTFSVPERYRFTEVSLKAVARNALGPGGSQTFVTYVRNGNTVTATVRLSPKDVLTTNLTISDPRVLMLECGNMYNVTNLDEHRFFVQDEIGLTELGKWRTWARDLYNGNRGANWSVYPAYQNVRIDGNHIVFDRKAHYSQRVDARTNLVTYAGGMPAIEIGHHGTAVTGALAITSCAVTNGTFYIGYFHDIAAFDPSQLKVMETYSLESQAVWSEVSESEITRVGSDRIVVAAQTGINQRFLKLHYIDGSESGVIEIALHGVVSVDELNVGGTNILALIKSGGTGGGISEQRAKEIAASSSVTNLGAVAAATNSAKAYVDKNYFPLKWDWQTETANTNNVNLLMKIGKSKGLRYKTYSFWLAQGYYDEDGSNTLPVLGIARTNSSNVVVFERFTTTGDVEKVITDFCYKYDILGYDRATNLFAPKLTGKTYDFHNGTDFTKNLYIALTNVIQTLGGSMTNAPAFN